NSGRNDKTCCQMLVLERDAIHVGYLVRDENQASMVAQLFSEFDGENRRVSRIHPAPIYSPRDIGDDQDRTHWNREILWCRSIRMRSSTEQRSEERRVGKECR